MTVDEAIKTALESVSDPYALGYLRAIPRAIEEGGESLWIESEDYLRVQIAYALNSMNPVAREVKGVLREYVRSARI